MARSVWGGLVLYVCNDDTGWCDDSSLFELKARDGNEETSIKKESVGGLGLDGFVYIR